MKVLGWVLLVGTVAAVVTWVEISVKIERDARFTAIEADNRATMEDVAFLQTIIIGLQKDSLGFYLAAETRATLEMQLVEAIARLEAVAIVGLSEEKYVTLCEGDEAGVFKLYDSGGFDPLDTEPGEPSPTQAEFNAISRRAIQDQARTGQRRLMGPNEALEHLKHPISCESCGIIEGGRFDYLESEEDPSVGYWEFYLDEGETE